MDLANVGQTKICQWKDDKTAAFSIGGDDSVHSQLDFMIPEMLKRGFRGTFWVNAGRGTIGERGFCWESRKSEWLTAARQGCDFGNHTMYHVGARFFAEAEYEIGESARNIWASNPGQRLQLFLSGGGTTWNVSREDVEEILQKYFCVPGRGGGRGTQDPCYHSETNTSATGEDLVSYVDKAIEERSWHFIGCHGVGPDAEWLPTDEEPFITLLDYLVEKQDKVWGGTHTEVHKYILERESAQVQTKEATDHHITLTLSSDTDPLLYDFPLTLKTYVPDTWFTCVVTQKRNKQTLPIINRMVQYDVLPDGSEINLTSV